MRLNKRYFLFQVQFGSVNATNFPAIDQRVFAFMCSEPCQSVPQSKDHVAHVPLTQWRQKRRNCQMPKAQMWIALRAELLLLLLLTHNSGSIRLMHATTWGSATPNQSEQLARWRHLTFTPRPSQLQNACSLPQAGT